MEEIARKYLMLLVSRGHWKLARVIRVEYDGDHVRKAYLRTADRKIVLRDRTKLVHLELDNES